MGIALTIPEPLLELAGDRGQEFGKELELNVTVSSGVVAEGDAASYALIWEFGNVRQHKKGPKTVLGVSLATGEQVWLSTQAPQGYIRVCEPIFWRYIREEIQNVQIGQGNLDATKKELKDMAMRVARKMQAELQRTVPVDSGALRESITPVADGDPVLDEPDKFPGQILQMEGK